MAKVVAPLQSFSASGKIGGSMVFFSHLGRNVVRSLVIPNNPKTTAQGDSRLLLGALGRAAKAIVSSGHFATDVKTVVTAGQTYVSSMIAEVINIYGGGNTGVAALQAEVDAHTASANFESSALSAGLTDFTIDYATTGDKTLTAGAQLYALAKYAFQVKATNPSLFARAPYTTALASWTSTQTGAFVTDLNS